MSAESILDRIKKKIDALPLRHTHKKVKRTLEDETITRYAT